MLFSTQLLRPEDTNTRVGPKNMLNVEKKELRELKLTIQLESEKRKNHTNGIWKDTQAKRVQLANRECVHMQFANTSSTLSADTRYRLVAHRRADIQNL